METSPFTPQSAVHDLGAIPGDRRPKPFAAGSFAPVAPPAASTGEGVIRGAECGSPARSNLREPVERSAGLPDLSSYPSRS
jgi:hypothetical protein